MSAISEQLDQLEAQQFNLTQTLAEMLAGNWCGEPPSAQAFLTAQDPSLNVQCVPPYRQSDVPAEAPGYYNPEESQPAQLYSWTCSACAVDWLLRALGSGFDQRDVYNSREYTVDAIGMPENINPTYGLMNGSGVELQRVLQEQSGIESYQGWLDFDSAYYLYSQAPGMMSGGNWYHWVGVRGVRGDALYVANSALGYKNVYDTVNRSQFNSLGPFSCVVAKL